MKLKDIKQKTLFPGSNTKVYLELNDYMKYRRKRIPGIFTSDRHESVLYNWRQRQMMLNKKGELKMRRKKLLDSIDALVPRKGGRKVN